MTHASLISRLMADEGNPGFDPESAIDHAERGEWGMSSVGTPEISTAMNGGTVIFSDNRSRFTCDIQIKDTARILRLFADEDALRVMAAAFNLTCGSDDSFTDLVKRLLRWRSRSWTRSLSGKRTRCAFAATRRSLCRSSRLWRHSDLKIRHVMIAPAREGHVFFRVRR